jgi:hypothetical protein
MDGEEELGTEIAFTPDQLCAMAHSRERLSIWSRRILLILWIGIAGLSVYNVFSVTHLWARLSQAWIFAWACMLIWKSRRSVRGMSAMESCTSFLQRVFEAKRSGMLEMRRYVLLLIPPILVSCWADSVRALRLTRLRMLGVSSSSLLYEFASGPWLFIVMALLLVLIWFAFGLAAKKASRELDDLRRRTQE